jgi:hypothetical protein
VYVVAAVSGPVLRLPLAGRPEVFKPPPATAQDAAFDAVQLSVDELMPLVTLAGLALNDWIVAGGTAINWAVAVTAKPSKLRQVSVYVVVAVIGPAMTLPGAVVPLKGPPVTAQDAPVDSAQLRVDKPTPLVTLDGFAPNDWICGGGTTVTVFVALWLPRSPVQVSVYFVVTAMPDIVWLPLRLLEPLQPSPALPSVAWHEVEFWVLHVSSVDAPG